MTDISDETSSEDHLLQARVSVRTAKNTAEATIALVYAQLGAAEAIREQTKVLERLAAAVHRLSPPD
jgi:hypothetical protein